VPEARHRSSIAPSGRRGLDDQRHAHVDEQVERTNEGLLDDEGWSLRGELTGLDEGDSELVYYLLRGC
jgi:hypothetical protein